MSLRFVAFGTAVLALAGLAATGRAQVITSYDNSILNIGTFDGIQASNFVNNVFGSNQANDPLPYSATSTITNQPVAGYSVTGTTSVTGTAISASFTMTLGPTGATAGARFNSIVKFTASTAFTYVATSSASYSGLTAGPGPNQSFSVVNTLSNSVNGWSGIIARYKESVSPAASGSFSGLDDLGTNFQYFSDESGSANGDNQCFPAGDYRFSLIGHLDRAYNATGSANYTVTLTPCIMTPPSPPTAPRTLVVTKFNDLNGNGVREAGEPPMAGWNFTATNGVSHSLVTDENGSAVLIEPNSGSTSYNVTETLQSGWISTTTPPPVTVNNSSTVIVEFGNRLAPEPDKTKVQFFKFLDVNDNGVFDFIDTPLTNWKMLVVDPNLTATTIMTDDNGMAFLNLSLSGNYQVSQTVDSDFLNANYLNVSNSNFSFNAAGNVANGAGDILTFQLPTEIAPVPEPSTIVLGGIGLLGLLTMVRTRRKRVTN